MRRGSGTSIWLATWLATLGVSAACTGRASKTTPGPCLIDLSYRYDEETVYWPTAPSRFEKTTLAYGMTDRGFFHAAYAISTPEHGGTHIDAPIHFAEGMTTVDEIPLERLVAPAVVIDMTKAAELDRDALLTEGDVAEFERTHGTIEPGTIVLVRTGWSRFWPEVSKYLGSDRPEDASDLHFPGVSEDAARALVERGVATVGIDTASIDHGPSQEFRAHRVLGEAGIPAIENVAGLDQLPDTGARVFALPMKVGGGSGAPVRIVAEIRGGCKP